MIKKKIQLKENKYNPAGGPVLRADAKVEIAAFWADKWIAEGTAVAIETAETPSVNPPNQNKGKNNVGKDTAKSKS